MAYETFGDLRKQALTKAGEVETQQSKYWDKMLEYIQQSYLDILSGSNKFNLDFSRGWDWARETNPIPSCGQPGDFGGGKTAPGRGCDAARAADTPQSGSLGKP